MEIRNVFKRIGDTKGIFHTKTGKIKDKRDRTRRDKENVERICRKCTKKALNDPVNYEYEVTHLEPDI